MNLPEMIANGLLAESVYMVPFLVAVLAVIFSFWKDTIALLAVALVMIAMYVFRGEVAAEDAATFAVIMEMARYAFMLILTVYAARRIGS